MSPVNSATLPPTSDKNPPLVDDTAFNDDTAVPINFAPLSSRMSPPPRLELLPLNVAPASCRMLPTPDASTAPPPPRADNAPVMVKPCAVTLPPSNTEIGRAHV